MKLRKCLSLLLAGVMAVSMAVPAFASETETEEDGSYPVMPMIEDAEAPELVSITLDTTVVEPNGEIQMTVVAKDDISGVDDGYVNFRCSERENGISGWFHSNENSYDEESKTWIMTGTINISEYELEGLYEISNVELWDRAQNNAIYFKKAYRDELPLPESCANLSFTVKENITEDSTAPELLDITFDTTVVEPNSEIQLTVTAKDDLSGLDYGSVDFYCSEREHGIDGWFNTEENSYDEESKTWTLRGTIEISQWACAGDYKIDSIYLDDRAGNHVWYYANVDEGIDALPIPASCADLSFTVKENPTEDCTSPELVSISINKESVKAPGQVQVTVSAKDDRSGFEGFFVRFYSSAREKEIGWSSYSDDVSYDAETGIWTLTDSIEIGEYELAGLYEIEYIQLRDREDNVHTYSNDTRNEKNRIPAPYNKLAFFVENTSVAVGDIESSTADAGLVDRIETEVADNGTAYIHYGQDATLPAEVFTAIEGTDKEVVLMSEGIEWVFNGQDIQSENVKEIDLEVGIERDRRSESENADEIEDALDKKNSIIVSFPPNGKLPGKATIRIKMDHVFRDYLDYTLGENSLYVYYYDNSTGKFVEVAAGISVGDDEYLTFEIDHNSDFVIMNGAYRKNEPQKPIVFVEEESYKVSLSKSYENGEVKADMKSATRGEKVYLTVSPDKGYVLDSLTVTNSKGEELKLYKEDGKYYFRMPEGKVSIDTEFVRAGSVSTEPEKENPSTGADDFVAASVALALCSAACAFALCNKKVL